MVSFVRKTRKVDSGWPCFARRMVTLAGERNENLGRPTEGREDTMRRNRDGEGEREREKSP